MSENAWSVIVKGINALVGLLPNTYPPPPSPPPPPPIVVPNPDGPLGFPVVYKSSDPGAPVLTRRPGGLVEVLRACLCDGYIGKPAAGWAKLFTVNYEYVFDRYNASTLYGITTQERFNQHVSARDVEVSINAVGTGFGEFYMGVFRQGSATDIATRAHIMMWDPMQRQFVSGSSGGTPNPAYPPGAEACGFDDIQFYIQAFYPGETLSVYDNLSPKEYQLYLNAQTAGAFPFSGYIPPADAFGYAPFGARPSSMAKIVSLGNSFPILRMFGGGSSPHTEALAAGLAPGRQGSFANTITHSSFTNWDHAASPIPWIVVADRRTFYLFVMSSGQRYTCFMFGDIYSYLPSDPYRVMMMGPYDVFLPHTSDTSPWVNSINANFEVGTLPAGHVLMRAHTGMARTEQHALIGDVYAIKCAKHSDYARNRIPIPNPNQGEWLFAPYYISEQTENAEPYHIRGNLRGLYAILNRDASILINEDIINVGGRQYLLLDAQPRNHQTPDDRVDGSMCFMIDITGPWDTNESIVTPPDIISEELGLDESLVVGGQGEGGGGPVPPESLDLDENLDVQGP